MWLQERFDGSGTGNFDLDAIAFATVGQVLDATAGKPDPKDGLVHRSLAQRRADALEEMALAYGPGDQAPQDQAPQDQAPEDRHQKTRHQKTPSQAQSQMAGVEVERPSRQL